MLLSIAIKEWDVPWIIETPLELFFRVTAAKRKGRFEIEAPNVTKMDGHESPSLKRGRAACLPLPLVALLNHTQLQERVAYPEVVD